MLRTLLFVFSMIACTARADVACPPWHIDESARVNYVYDGDTLQLEDGRKIRLIGIDTPEVHSRYRVIPADIKSQGERAKAALQRQLNTADNHVGLAFGSQRLDRYGRTLAHVFLPDGTNVQAWLIEQGLAIAFTTPPSERLAPCYQQREAIARKAERGIWQMPQYQLKRVAQLNNKSRGFRRVQADVSRIWQSSRGVTLLLDEALEIRIYKADLPNFNVHMLNNLQGKRVRVRGWLKPKKIQANRSMNKPGKALYRMTLRHPHGIKIIH